jgi:beta-N-acetylhexosaminidase
VFIGGWHDAQTSVSRISQALVAAVRTGRLSLARLAESADRTRRLAAWAAGARRAGTPATDPGVGLVAARRALRVTGRVAPLPAPPYVIELAPPVNAHGPGTAWGLIPALTRRWPATAGRRLTGPPDDVPALVAAAAGQPLVIAVRDAHRYPWVVATLRAALAARPDAAVVEMGLPHGDVPPCGAYLATYGDTAVSAFVAASALTDGWQHTD